MCTKMMSILKSLQRPLTMTKREIYIIQKTPGNAFTTYKSPDGLSAQLPIGPDVIGPFDSIPEAADYLSRNAILHASYEVWSKWSPKENS